MKSHQEGLSEFQKVSDLLEGYLHLEVVFIVDLEFLFHRYLVKSWG